MIEAHSDGLLHLLSATQAASIENHDAVQPDSLGSASRVRDEPESSAGAVSQARSTPQQQTLQREGSSHQQHEEPQSQPIQTKPWRSNQCHLCDRSYERADHLQRHLRSHENTRPYECTICPQRFNRVDLLQRHQASHNRTGRTGSNALMKDGRPRTRIERLGRAATACVHCVASKTKCQDRKPCARCVRRHLHCTTSPNSGTAQRSSSQTAETINHENNVISTGNSIVAQSWLPSVESHGADLHAASGQRIAPVDSQSAGTVWREGDLDARMDDWHVGYGNSSNVAASREQPLMDDEAFLQMSSILNPDFGLNSGFGFMPRDAYLAQDSDPALWDFSFDGLELAYENFGRDQIAPVNPRENPSPSGNLLKAASKRHAAFERSAWIWKPTKSDQALNDQSDLHLDEESIPSILDPTSPSQDGDDFAACCIDSSMRDQIVGLLSRLAKDSNRNVSFPSLHLVNRIIRVYFAQSTFWTDSMIHSSTFDGSKALPQLNIAIIAAGASLSFIPAVWKMGMALQETVRLTVGEYWEKNNSNTRNLQALQAFVMGLDIGIWSGFKRKMEIAESFGQPVIAVGAQLLSLCLVSSTVFIARRALSFLLVKLRRAQILRRAGAFAVSRTPEALAPSVDDSDTVLESKWNIWVERESFKRLVLHLFVHDVFASAGLQKPPLMSFTELKFELPFTDELWHARSAHRWRDIYIHTLAAHETPNFMDVLSNPKILLMHEQQVNVHLSALIILHGFWVQIWNNLETRKYYGPTRTTHRLCLLTSQAELYRDLLGFAAKLPSLTKNSAEPTMLCELYMMILHAPPEDLQRFAGRFGEGEAYHAAEEFKEWAETQDARNAVWHAGQVFKAARLLHPMQLRGFNSIALYYATLTLWVFGLMSSEVDELTAHSPVLEQVALNEVETIQSCSFRATNEGVAGLAVVKAGIREFIPLSEADRVLQVARDIYTSNFPISDEPLPPLTASLRDLLKELSSLLTSQTTRAPTVAP